MKFTRIIISCLLICGLISAKAQQAEVYDSTDLSGGNIDKVARDRVVFKPGAKFKPISGVTLKARIDENITLPVAIPSLLGPTVRASVDPNKEAGSIAGVAALTHSGSATYSIPIYCSPGTAGMQPNISISYNSQSRSGLLGVGWDISGVSSITRVGQNNYFNEVTKPVEYNTGDGFVLDGQRLVLNGGTSTSLIYSTESESFMTITSQGLSGNGPESFKVVTKEGTILEYGLDANARLLGNSSTVHKWSVSKITDANGNYMIFEYNNDGFEMAIQRIMYTGNAAASITPYNVLEFNYDIKPDAVNEYISGRKFTSGLKLRQIKAFHSGGLYKTYKFTYGLDQYTKLTEVTELSPDGKQYNSTLVNWGNNTITPQTTIDTTAGGPFGHYYDKQLGKGDFDGDGTTDYLYYRNGGSVKKFTVYFSRNKQFFDLPYTVSTNNNDVDVSASILNFDEYADKLDEIYILSGNQAQLGFKGFKWNGGGFSQIYNAVTSAVFVGMKAFLGSPSSVVMDELMLVPVNHLGDQDNKAIIVLRNNTINGQLTSQSVAGVIGGSTGLINPTFTQLDIAKERSLRFVDFDADGTTEIAELIPVGSVITYRIFKYSPDVGTYFLQTSDYAYTSADHLEFGDFNGDGNSDMLFYGPTNLDASAKWRIRYSDGNVFLNPVNVDFLNTALPDPARVQVNDLDNDGRTDIVFTGNYAYKALYFLRSNGSAFEPFEYWMADSNEFQYGFDIGDLDGNGRGDILAVRYRSSSPFSFYFIRHEITGGETGNMVTEVIDGYNNSTLFTYTGGYNRSGIHAYTHNSFVSDPGQQYGYVHRPLYLAFRLHKIVAGQWIEYIQMGYEDGIYHSSGKGFLGYSKVTKTQFFNGLGSRIEETVNELNQNLALMSPVSLTVTGYDHSNNPLLLGSEQYEYELAPNVSGFRRYWQRPKKITVKDELANMETVTEYESYDDYGNLLDVSTVNTGSANRTTTNTSYVPTNSTVTIPNQPSQVIVTVDKISSSAPAGDPAYSRTTQFEYDGKGNMLTSVSDPGTAAEVTTELEYNSSGLVTKTTLKASGLTNRVTRLEYDDLNRFAIREYNVLGQGILKTFEPIYGNVLQVTDLDTKVTKFTYNNLGRMLTSTDKYGIKTTFTRKWENNAFEFYEKQVTPGMPDQQVWYNQLGLKVRSMQVNANNTAVYVSYQYNSRMQLTKQSLPYLLQNGPSRYIDYSYEVATPRLTSVVDDGRTTTISYDPTARTTTTTLVNTNDPSKNRIKIQTSDADGRLASSSDGVGTNNYAYWRNGKVKSISAAGASSAFEYDDFARLTHHADHDRGTRDYQYNAWGEMIWERDAVGNETTYELDVTGRATKKTVVSGSQSKITTYAYKASNPGINKLQSAVGPDVEQQFFYDAFSNVVSSVDKIDGQSYITTFAYNDKGLNTAVNYPNSFGIKKEYDGQERLKKITRADNNATIWEAASYDYLDRITKAWIGPANGLSYNFVYNANFLLSNEYIKDEVAPKNIYQRNYDFEYLTGDLLSRSAPLKNLMGGGLAENMTYDKADRLTQVELNGMTGLQVTYEDNGNIESKSDVSINPYQYAGFPAHGVSNVSDPFLPVQSLSQVITYNERQRPITIFEGTEDPATTKELVLVYGPDDQRRKTEYTAGGQLEKTIIYSGNYEKHITTAGTKEFYYIKAPTGLAAVLIRNAGSTNMYYVGSDNIGSINTLIAADRSVALEQHFDAWGNKKNPDTWNGLAPGLSATFEGIRGYTGHEHLDAFGLINMNARLYDPFLGRMLGPDPFIVDQTDPQHYNRFSYALNNPFKYTDPTGETVKPNNSQSVEDDAPGAVSKFDGDIVADNLGCNLEDWMAGQATGDQGDPKKNKEGLSTDQPLTPEQNMQKTVAAIKEMIASGEYLASAKPQNPYGSLVRPVEGWASGALGEPLLNVEDIVSLGGSLVFKAGLKYGVAAIAKIATKDAVEIAAKKGAQYSVAFEMKLSSNLYPGIGAYTHFKAANTTLAKTMASDVTFAKTMTELGVIIPRSLSGTILGKSPKNFVWHHAAEKGVMQLVPKGQHTAGSVYWNTMHPGKKGGMSLWGGGY